MADSFLYVWGMDVIQRVRVPFRKGLTLCNKGTTHKDDS